MFTDQYHINSGPRGVECGHNQRMLIVYLFMFQFRWPRPGGRGWQWRRPRPGGRAPGASSPGQKSRRSKWLSWSFSVSGQQQNIAIITCCLFILKNPSNLDSCSVRTCFEFFLFQFLYSVGPHTSCSIFSRWDLSAFHMKNKYLNPRKSVEILINLGFWTHSPVRDNQRRGDLHPEHGAPQLGR